MILVPPDYFPYMLKGSLPEFFLLKGKCIAKMPCSLKGNKNTHFIGKIQQDGWMRESMRPDIIHIAVLQHTVPLTDIFRAEIIKCIFMSPFAEKMNRMPVKH